MKLYSEYTLEELLGFVRAGEGCEGLYDAIAEKVASLRSQHSRDEAVVEGLEAEHDAWVLRELHQHDLKSRLAHAAAFEHADALLREKRERNDALSAREEAGQ